MKAFLQKFSAVVRRVIGAPDYDAYVAHVRAHHPDSSTLTREAFVRDRLEARYSKPGAKCC